MISADHVSAMDQPPLFVDLDGTLLAGDTLRISLTALMLQRPWVMLPLASILLVKGLVAFKAEVARRYPLDPCKLPWRSEVLDFLRTQHAGGRKLILATASHRQVGERMAAHLGFFDAVIGSDTGPNLKGGRKTSAILAFTGGAPFDYAGDAWADVPVFEAARRCILVTRNPRLLARVQRIGRIEAVFRV